MKARCPDCGYEREQAHLGAACPNCQTPLVLELAVRRDGITRALTLPRALRRPVQLRVVRDAETIERLEAAGEDVDADVERPRNREDCRDGPRPCPWVGCRYHLYLDVHPRTGAIKLNFPDREVDELAETCSLDVAERGGITLDVVGLFMNIVRERVRQIEAAALFRLKSRSEEG